MDVRVVFENKRVLVVDKPGGWLSVPARQGDADARVCLGRELEKVHGRLWPCHRLDREATGLVMFARDAMAHRTASLWFEKRLIHKTYEAWTSGSFAAGAAEVGTAPTQGIESVWRCRMAHGKKRSYLAEFGKDAVTRARWTDDLTWAETVVQRWELFPETGRSHQLRFELARRGFPILGDTLYGSKVAFAPDTIALRAVMLDLGKCSQASELGLPDRLTVSSIKEIIG